MLEPPKAYSHCSGTRSASSASVTCHPVNRLGLKILGPVKRSRLFNKILRVGALARRSVASACASRHAYNCCSVGGPSEVDDFGDVIFIFNGAAGSLKRIPAVHDRAASMPGA